MLSIQTKFQYEILKKFGNITVCIDSTHQTNHYSYPLNTLMVIDEYGEGIPVAYLLCNRVTGDILKMFFSAIKARVGPLEPEVFMTDDAPQYFSAWQHVFGKGSEIAVQMAVWAHPLQKKDKNHLRTKTGSPPVGRCQKLSPAKGGVAPPTQNSRIDARICLHTTEQFTPYTLPHSSESTDLSHVTSSLPEPI